MTNPPRVRIMVIMEEGMEPKQYSSLTYIREWALQMIADLRQIHHKVWLEETTNANP